MMKNYLLLVPIFGFAVSSCSAKSSESVINSAEPTMDIQVGGTLRKLQNYIPSDEDSSRLSGDRSQEVNATIFSQTQAGGSPNSASVRHLMSSVKDQGSRGTCSVFAAAALLEFGTSLDISEQCLAREASDKDPGHIAQRLSYAVQHGVFLEKDCTYNSFWRDSGNPNASLKLSFSRPIELLPKTSLESLQTLKQRVASGYPVGISVFVSTTRFSETENSIISMPTKDENICINKSSCGGHAIVVVGYDDSNKVLTFKNSWGDDWKDAGYGMMTYEYFLSNYLGGTINQMAVVH